MVVEINKLSFPVEYEIADSDKDSDSRFKKVKIRVAHTGENLNNTIFTKNSLEKMSKTLGLIPIVGYIEKNEEDEDDFSNHKQLIRLTKNDIEYEYLGHAYGLIPENPNVSFEIFNGKEWLCTEGYIWTKFEKAVGIFDNSSNIKSQSMEIDNIDGFIDDDGILNIENAIFSALCILGEDVQPAMAGSTIEMFSANDFKQEIKMMMQEFSKKGENDLDKDKEKKDTKKSVEVADEKEVKDEKDTKDEKDKEYVKEKETDNAEVADTKAKDEKEEDKKVDKAKKNAKDDGEQEEKDEDKDKEKKFSIVFEMSHEDIRSSLYAAVKSDSDDTYGWIPEVYNDHFIYQETTYEEEYTTKYYDIKYTVEDSGVSIGEKIEVFPKFLTKEEADKVESDRERLVDLEKELKELNSYKESFEKKEKTKALEEYSERLEEESYATLAENIDKYTKEEFDREIAFSVLKAESAKKENSGVGAYSANSLSDETNKMYGEYSRFFKK